MIKHYLIFYSIFLPLLVVSQNPDSSNWGSDSTHLNSRNGMEPLNNKPTSMSAMFFHVPKRKNKPIPDSLKKNIQFSLLQISSGNLSLGYDYGLTPFSVGYNKPGGFSTLNGSSGFNIKDLPFIVNFQYIYPKPTFGINNYFRISFDSERFGKKIKQQKFSRDIEYDKELQKLSGAREQKLQEISFLKFKQQNPNNFNRPVINDMEQGPRTVDSMDFDYSGIMETPDFPSRNKSENFPKDLITQPHNPDYSLSSIQKIQSTQREIELIEEQIRKTKQMKELLKEPDNFGNKPGQEMNTQSVFSCIKKLDIGLNTPDHSYFLMNAQPVFGVNMEVQRSLLFMAISLGKVQGNGQNLRLDNSTGNIFQNFRDPVNNVFISSGDKRKMISAIKFGYGTREQTHLFTGMLYGVEKTRNGTLSDSINNNYSGQGSKNFVYEIDGKYSIGKSLSFDLIYGKSNVTYEPISIVNGFYGLLDSTQRSNAALFRFNIDIPTIKSNLSISSRWVDPFFNSYGVGFMKSDNFRYEFKWKQNLRKIIKLKYFLRREQDNLFEIANPNVIMTTLGFDVTVKISKRLTSMIGSGKIWQRWRIQSNLIGTQSNNYFLNSITVWNPRIGKYEFSLSFLYNFFMISDDIINNRVHNYGLISSIPVNAFRHEFSANLFYSENIKVPVLTSKIFLLKEEISWSAKNGVKFTGGIKWTDGNADSSQVGYRAKISFPIYSKIYSEFLFEKILAGEFFNTYGNEMVGDFPYLISGKLNFRF